MVVRPPTVRATQHTPSREKNKYTVCLVNEENDRGNNNTHSKLKVLQQIYYNTVERLHSFHLTHQEEETPTNLLSQEKTCVYQVAVYLT